MTHAARFIPPLPPEKAKRNATLWQHSAIEACFGRDVHGNKIPREKWRETAVQYLSYPDRGILHPQLNASALLLV